VKPFRPHYVEGGFAVLLSEVLITDERGIAKHGVKGARSTLVPKPSKEIPNDDRGVGILLRENLLGFFGVQFDGDHRTRGSNATSGGGDYSTIAGARF
jgi:hypothetical protein